MAQRPADLKPPAHLAPNTPVPQPAPTQKRDDPEERDPTRYGDWELNGIAIDF